MPASTLTEMVPGAGLACTVTVRVYGCPSTTVAAVMSALLAPAGAIHVTSARPASSVGADVALSAPPPERVNVTFSPAIGVPPTTRSAVTSLVAPASVSGAFSFSVTSPSTTNVRSAVMSGASVLGVDATTSTTALASGASYCVLE